MLRTDGETWDDARDALLIERYKGGAKARLIAEELAKAGFPVTRNGVLGRIFRLRRDGKLDAPLRQAPTRGVAMAPKPVCKGELPPTGCRWIEGEPAGVATVWCDAPVARPGLSYCAEHMARCWRGKGDDEKPKRPVIDTGFVRQPVKVA